MASVRYGVIDMTARAHRSKSQESAAAVLLVRDRLKMRRVDASRIRTEVIEDETGGDRTDVKPIADPVRVVVSSVAHVESAVTG